MGKKLFNIFIGTAAFIVFAATFYFFPLYTIIAILMAALVVCVNYLVKFAKMIMILEDDLGNAIESLNEVEESMGSLISMKLYFDTPEVAKLVNGVMDSVRMARFSVNKIIDDLTNRSKQKWVLYVEDEEEEENQEKGTTKNERPNLIGNKEGTLFSVERE